MQFVKRVKFNIIQYEVYILHFRILRWRTKVEKRTNILMCFFMCIHFELFFYFLKCSFYSLFTFFIFFLFSYFFSFLCQFPSRCFPILFTHVFLFSSPCFPIFFSLFSYSLPSVFLFLSLIHI